MFEQIHLGAITVDVIKKDIKNVHLSVHPPTGRVRIAAPSRLSNDTIRVFAVSKLNWIKRQQHKLREQERETPREYLDRETHYVWGNRYLLQICERNGPSTVEINHHRLMLAVRPHSNEQSRHAVLESWYRGLIRQEIPQLLAKWEPLLGVKVGGYFVRRMKTKWGSCNHNSHNIRLNTDLAKKPPQCLEYLLVHEMIHLIEPTHNVRFISLMDQYMPKWRSYRQILNRLPVRHEHWGY